jgi:hypothetical protein
MTIVAAAMCKLPTLAYGELKSGFTLTPPTEWLDEPP